MLVLRENGERLEVVREIEDKTIYEETFQELICEIDKYGYIRFCDWYDLETIEACTRLIVNHTKAGIDYVTSSNFQSPESLPQ